MVRNTPLDSYLSNSSDILVTNSYFILVKIIVGLLARLVLFFVVACLQGVL